MATKEDGNSISLSDVEALITDINGKMYARLKADTTNEINGAIKANINPLTESLGSIAKQLEIVQQLSAKVESTDSRMSEIFTALQAPDDDDTNQPITPQPNNIEEVLAKARAEWEESSKQDKERIQALEQSYLKEKQDAEAAKQLQRDQKRDSEFAQKAQELGVKPNRIASLLFQLKEDGIATLSEDGSKWLLKSSKEDPFVKGRKEEVLLPLDQGLPEIAQSSYSDFLPPRAGAGTNSSATQSYSPSTSRITDATTPEDLQKGFASNDTTMINELAARIAAQGA